MPDAFKDIWDIPLSDDERGELEREDIIERPDVIRRVRVSSRKRVFGPRQIEWMIDALNDAWEKLPSGAGAAFYRCAFETIVKSCRLSRLDLVERLRAYRDDDAGKAQERRITRLEHKQRKHIRALSKWGKR
jgi:hypothetical protein